MIFYESAEQAQFVSLKWITKPNKIRIKFEHQFCFEWNQKEKANVYLNKPVECWTKHFSFSIMHKMFSLAFIDADTSNQNSKLKSWVVAVIKSHQICVKLKTMRVNRKSFTFQHCSRNGSKVSGKIRLLPINLRLFEVSNFHIQFVDNLIESAVFNLRGGEMHWNNLVLLECIKQSTIECIIHILYISST